MGGCLCCGSKKRKTGGDIEDGTQDTDTNTWGCWTSKNVSVEGDQDVNAEKKTRGCWSTKQSKEQSLYVPDNENIIQEDLDGGRRKFNTVNVVNENISSASEISESDQNQQIRKASNIKFSIIINKVEDDTNVKEDTEENKQGSSCCCCCRSKKVSMEKDLQGSSFSQPKKDSSVVEGDQNNTQDPKRHKSSNSHKKGVSKIESKTSDITSDTDNRSESEIILEKERIRAQTLRKRATILRQYDDRMIMNFPEGVFTPDSKPSFPEVNDVYTVCVYVPDSQILRMHYLQLQDVDPGNLTSDEFDQWCCENEQFNAIGQHAQFIEADNLPDDLLLQHIGDTYQIYLQISDQFLCTKKGLVRAVTIHGQSLDDVSNAMKCYLTQSNCLEITPVFLENDLSKKNHLNGDYEFREDSSCNEISPSKRRGDTFWFYRPNDLKYDTPGLTQLSDGMYEYKIFIPLMFPLQRIPLKRISKAFSSRSVKLCKNDSVIYRQRPNYSVSILGYKIRDVLLCRTELTNKFKTHDDVYCIHDYNRVEESQHC